MPNDVVATLRKRQREIVSEQRKLESEARKIESLLAEYVPSTRPSISRDRSKPNIRLDNVIAEDRPNVVAVRNVLTSNWQSLDEIAEESGVHRSTVSGLTKAMERSGEVERRRVGREMQVRERSWVLAESGEVVKLGKTSRSRKEAM